MKDYRVTTKFKMPEDEAIIKLLKDNVNRSKMVRDLAVKGFNKTIKTVRPISRKKPRVAK